MTESIPLKIILLLTAALTLATEVVRLASEWTPAHTPGATVTGWGNPGDVEAYGQGREGREFDAFRSAERRMRPWAASAARGPPHDLRETGPAWLPKLRPDLSIYHPQWCVDCRQAMPRLERRRFRERCSACHLLRG